MIQKCIPILPHSSRSVSSQIKMDTWPETLGSPARLASEDGQCPRQGVVVRIAYLTLEFLSVCPGRHLADPSVWLTVASLLSVFNITHALDEYGRKIDVSYARDPNPGFIR
jgi:hypothetical protein